MERRMKDRTEYPARLRYRVADGEWENGFLEDISTTGVKIYTREDYEPDTKIEIEMQSHLDPEPVRMHVRVVRREEQHKEGYAALGCELL